MTGIRAANRRALLLATLVIFGCAGGEALIRAPAVNLTSVEVSKLSFSNQTFLLGFSVSNPNPFPLPVKTVRYRVRLNDQSFAGGETQGNFTIPAGADESFVISVDVDLLRSGARLTSIVRSGVRDSLDYEVNGNLDIDIPTTPSIKFSSSGTIMVQFLHEAGAETHQGQKEYG